jgi:hypothetical protein
MIARKMRNLELSAGHAPESCMRDGGEAGRRDRHPCGQP